jgi:hypothetical protein
LRHRRARARASLAAVVALVTAVSLVVGADAAPAKTRMAYRPAAVLAAFKAEGVKLVTVGVGTSSPVTSLISPKPQDGWRAGVFVYPNDVMAKTSYESNIHAWQSSGMAAARRRNVVVTVVPNGRRVGRKSKAFAIPTPVVRAIAAFTNR